MHVYRHPDKNPDDETATAKFQAINTAYRRLTQADTKVDSDDEDDDEEGFGGLNGVRPSATRLAKRLV